MNATVMRPWLLDPNKKLRFGINDIENVQQFRTWQQQEELTTWISYQQLPFSCTTGLYLIDEHGHSIEVHRHCCVGEIGYGLQYDGGRGPLGCKAIVDPGASDLAVDPFMKICYELHTDRPLPLDLIMAIDEEGRNYPR